MRKTLILQVVLLALLLPSASTADDAPKLDAYTRQELMAAFLYRIGSYVEWENRALPIDAPTVNLCIAGRDPFGKALAFHDGSPIKGRALSVRHVSPTSSVEGCHILFLSRSEQHAARILHRLKSLSGVLTASDRSDFTCRGVVLRFFVQTERLTFEVNPKAAARSNLEISSKVLSLARLTEPSECEEPSR